MTASVPETPPYLLTELSRIASGMPVKAGTWRATADMLNWINGHGTTLIAGTTVVLQPSTVAVSYTMKYWVFGDDWHSSRAFIITLGNMSLGYYAPAPSSGTITINGNDYPFSFEGPPTPFYITEDYSVGRNASPATGAAAGEEITIVITLGAYTGLVEVHNITMVEAPKNLLTSGSDGVDQALFRRALPIYADATHGAEQLSSGVAFGREVARRGCMFTWQDTTASTYTTTSGTYSDFFLVKPALQSRSVSEPSGGTRSCKVSVYGKISGGATGRVHFVMDSGDVLSIDVTGSSYAWFHGTMSVSVDNPSAAHGGTWRSGGSDGDRDGCAITWKIQSGAGTFHVCAICISDPCGT